MSDGRRSTDTQPETRLLSGVPPPCSLLTPPQLHCASGPWRLTPQLTQSPQSKKQPNAHLPKAPAPVARLLLNPPCWACVPNPPHPMTHGGTCQKGSKMLNTQRTPVDKSLPSQSHSNTHRALWDCFLVDPVWQRLTAVGHADSRRPVLKRKWSHRTRRGMAHALNTSVFVFTPTETQRSASGNLSSNTG